MIRRPTRFTSEANDSRKEARLNANGDLILLEDQDRSRWNREQIAEGVRLVEDALRSPAGPFAIQAAIAAVHCEAASAAATDWPQIVRLYNVLARIQPSPVVSLNRAVALAMAVNLDFRLRILRSRRRRRSGLP